MKWVKVTVHEYVTPLSTISKLYRWVSSVVKDNFRAMREKHPSYRKSLTNFPWVALVVICIDSVGR